MVQFKSIKLKDNNINDKKDFKSIEHLNASLGVRAFIFVISRPFMMFRAVVLNLPNAVTL